MNTPSTGHVAFEIVDVRTQPSVRSAVATLSDTEHAEKHRAFLAAATTDNTRQAYRSSIKHYLEWGGVLPADEQAIIRYLVNFSDSLNPRTLALRLTAISQWHVHQGFPDSASTPNVRKTLAGISRTNGRPKKKAKALPVEDLELIVSALSSASKLKAIRDNALLQVGFFGGFRRSELVDLEIDYVSWDTQGITITLPRSKTDQTGEGITKAIPYGRGICCPATALRTWLDAASVTSGPIFRRINKWSAVGTEKLNPASVNSILIEAADLAKLGYVPELSSHSLRRGMATSAYRAGAEFRDIKKQGGWRNDATVQGYIEEAALFEENAAGTLLKSRSS